MVNFVDDVRKSKGRLARSSDDRALVKAVRSRLIGEEQLRLAIADIVISLLPGTPSVDMISRSFHISSRTLNRRLNTHNLSYRDLIADIKCSRAQKLILDGELSVSAIAKHLGYSDASNFTKAFKKWTGMTPRNFRECELS